MQGSEGVSYLLMVKDQVSDRAQTRVKPVHALPITCLSCLTSVLRSDK